MKALLKSFIVLFALCALSISVISCKDKGQTDDIVDQVTDNYKSGNCKKIKTINKNGNVIYEYDVDSNMVKSTFRDTAGNAPIVTDYFYTGTTLDSIKSGSTTWTIVHYGTDSVVVRKYVGISVREKYVYKGIDEKGLPQAVSMYDYKETIPHTEILYYYDGNENMRWIEIIEDQDKDGTSDNSHGIYYEYYEHGHHENEDNPNRWLNPFGGADWSENAAFKATFKDSDGKVTAEVDYDYEFNEYGYPTSVTVHGKLTTFEWDCVE